MEIQVEIDPMDYALLDRAAAFLNALEQTNRYSANKLATKAIEKFMEDITTYGVVNAANAEDVDDQHVELVRRFTHIINHLKQWENEATRQV